MKKTNYDQSSTGINLELVAFADTEISRIDFGENFSILEHETYRKTSFLFYTDFGQHEAPRRLSDCYNLDSVTEKQARAYCISSQQDNTKPRDEKRAREHLREIIEEKRRNYTSWGDYQIDLLNETSLYEAARDGFPTVPGAVLLYDVESARGYSQGDYALILFKLQEPYTDKDGNQHKPYTDDRPALRKMFSHYLYEAPAYIRLTIDDVDHDLTEALPDPYEYDRETVIEYARDALKLDPRAVEFLENRLPEYLEYN